MRRPPQGELASVRVSPSFAALARLCGVCLDTGAPSRLNALWLSYQMVPARASLVSREACASDRYLLEETMHAFIRAFGRCLAVAVLLFAFNAGAQQTI